MRAKGGILTDEYPACATSVCITAEAYIGQVILGVFLKDGIFVRRNREIGNKPDLVSVLSVRWSHPVIHVQMQAWAAVFIMQKCQGSSLPTDYTRQDCMMFEATAVRPGNILAP